MLFLHRLSCLQSRKNIIGVAQGYEAKVEIDSRVKAALKCDHKPRVNRNVEKAKGSNTSWQSIEVVEKGWVILPSVLTFEVGIRVKIPKDDAFWHNSTALQKMQKHIPVQRNKSCF